MSENVVPETMAAPSAPTMPVASGFAFTDAGCRTEVRLGGLLVLAAVFLWLFLGPAMCGRIFLVGAPLLLVGIPLQAWQGRTQGRPGYPWKLGVAFALMGAVMVLGHWLGLPDLCYRERVGGPLLVQPIGWLLAAAGIWILAWWPVARSARAGDA
jgi:hypothetical protein